MSIRQSRLGQGALNVEAVHKERQFRIKKDANDIIEEIFQNVSLKKASKDEKSKGQKIEELKELVEKQKENIEQLKADLKKEKTKNMMAQKASAKGIGPGQDSIVNLGP